MSLESIISTADKWVLRQYSKVGKKLNLYEGNRKYWVGYFLGISSPSIYAQSSRILFGEDFARGTLFLTLPIDLIYSSYGVAGKIKDENDSETKAVDKKIHFFRFYNSILRLPALAAGVGMVGKFGVDLSNYVAHGVPLGNDSFHYLTLGLGMVSVSSSMYIKEIDPKLLKKYKLREFVYNWVKEKVSSLVPGPLPDPVPAKMVIDDYASKG